MPTGMSVGWNAWVTANTAVPGSCPRLSFTHKRVGITEISQPPLGNRLPTAASAASIAS